jgi:putative flavoprotein involved in K+ transport
MPWQHTRGSALLGWVKHDAQHIAEHINAHTARQRFLSRAGAQR